MNLIKDALGYVKLGCFVFPCKLDKTPMTAHGFQDASNDREIVKAWWTEHPDASIGIACGATGWLVLDVDPDKGGFESYAELRDRDIITPDDLLTFTTRTGSGGMHIVWKQPEGAQIGNSAGKLGKGLDTRGDGGYIIAPPSPHPSGNAYQIELNAKPQPAPARLVELLKEKPVPPQAEAKPIPTTMSVEMSLQRAYERIANATEGTRNEIINKATWYLYGLVREGKLREQDVVGVVEAAAQRCGYPQNETRGVLRSVAGKR